MKTKFFLFAIALMFCAVPMFAQGGAPTGGVDGTTWFPAGFAMAIASGLCALGQGKAIAGACEGIARNPSANNAIRASLILGLVLIESLALYVFAILFIFRHG